MPPSRPSSSPSPRRSSSRLRERATAEKKKKSPQSKLSPSKLAIPSAAASLAVAKRQKELASARDDLGLFKTPFTILRLFGVATAKFLYSNVLSFATSMPALAGLYPLIAAYAYTHAYLPELYTPPDCLGGAAGLLYYPQVQAYEAAWWLTLGILSSIGLGTGLHSGIMFLWPFSMSVILRAEACRSTAFNAMYNHPCNLQCETTSGAGDGSLTFLNTLLLLWPTVILWGSGTAIGELPPYFITRAAKRAGTKATDYEAELLEAKENTDVISRLKVWTISFTERHGFLGILLLASWPNAAFDMCGMACGWLEMPFWTFFGATLVGKGLVKVTLQSLGCIAVFGPAFWEVLLGVLPNLSMPAAACKAADVPADAACTLASFLTAGRAKAMLKFSLQRRMLPSELLGRASAIDESALIDKYCGVLKVCGERSFGGYADASRYKEMAAIAERVMGDLDSDGDGRLTLTEIEVAQGLSDGKLSLASIDPGTGGLLSVGNLWNAFIAGLVLFFIYSIVEQVALTTQAANDADELEALEEKLMADEKSSGKRKAK